MIQLAALLLASALGSLIVADLVFSLLPSFTDYVVARVGVEYLTGELRRLQGGDKRVERRRRKLMPKFEEARRRLSRASLVRLLIILPLYIATAYVSIATPIVFPTPCCIEVLAVKVKGICIVTAPIYVALAYIALLPLVQDSLAMILMLKRGWVEGIARRLERW